MLLSECSRNIFWQVKTQDEAEVRPTHTRWQHRANAPRCVSQNLGVMATTFTVSNYITELSDEHEKFTHFTIILLIL